MNKIYKSIEDSYNESYFKHILQIVGQWISILFKNSLLVQFMISNIDVNRHIDNSIFFAISNNSKISNLKLKKIIENSIILSFLINRDIQFYVFISVLVLSPFISTSITVILGSIAVILSFFSILTKGNSIKYPKLYLFFLSLFLLSVIIGSIFNYRLKSSPKIFIIYIVYIILGLMIPYIVNSKYKLKVSLKSIAFTSIFICIYGLYQFIYGAPMDKNWIDTTFGSNIIRVYSVFGNPNVFGEYLILIIPIIFFLFKTTKSKTYKIIYFLTMLLAISNVFMTFSRGSLVGLIIGILIVVLLKAREYLPLLIIMGIISPFFLSDSMLKRILSIFSPKDTSTNYRRTIYRISIDILKDNYLTGIGLGQFQEVYKFYSLGIAKSFHGHNTYLMIFIELGILGFFSFLFMFISWSRLIFSTLKSKDREIGLIAICIFAGIISCSIQGIVDHIWHNYDIFLMYFIFLGLGCATTCLIGEESGDIYE